MLNRSKDEALKALINAAKDLNSMPIKVKRISNNTKLGLDGNFQYENASTAFTAAKFLIPSISMTKVRQALASTSWSGRIQKLNDGKIFNLRKNITVIDGSHNQDGAIVLNQYLTKNSLGKWNIIIGMLNNREVKDFIKIFSNHINQIYAITIPESKNSHSATDYKI